MFKKKYAQKKRNKNVDVLFCDSVGQWFYFFFFNQVDDFDVQNLEFSIVNVEKLAR